ncbi:jg25837, partial [Pararge aegeria aegeria]
MAALAQLDTEQELPTCGTAWTALTHHQKHVLLHDRVLAAAPDDGTYHFFLNQVGSLCRTVLEKYESVATDKNSPVLKAFILVLLSPAKSVRTAGIEEVKALLAREDRAILARNLVQKLNEVLEEG